MKDHPIEYSEAVTLHYDEMFEYLTKVMASFKAGEALTFQDILMTGKIEWLDELICTESNITAFIVGNSYMVRKNINTGELVLPVENNKGAVVETKAKFIKGEHL